MVNKSSVFMGLKNSEISYASVEKLSFGGGLVGIQIEVQFYLLFLGDYNYLRLKNLAALLKPRGSDFVFLR